MPLASHATNCMNAVDTNILIYVQDTRDPVKQAKAVELIDTLTEGVLLWQVACEYVAASRKPALQSKSLVGRHLYRMW